LVFIDNLEIGTGVPTRIMGVINVSPESHYKKSVRTTVQEIAAAASEMQEQGADILDVGAMSTAPYLETVISVEQEVKRMRLAIDAVKRDCSLPISVDTLRSQVAKEAIRMGVNLINDISGLKYDKKMANIISQSGLHVIVSAYGGQNGATSGHFSGTVKTLNESIDIARRAAIANEKIIIDPAIGFFRQSGKNPFFTKMADLPWYVRDIEVISNLKKLQMFSMPICISVSRKSFLGNIFNLASDDLLIPSAAVELICILNGANIIRTHDVVQTWHAKMVSELFG
jgi:dihydropteroate synthase